MFFKVARKLRMSMVFPSSKDKNVFVKFGYSFIDLFIQEI